jgi:hypothetical protein
MDYRTLGHSVAQAEFCGTPGQSSIKPTEREMSWENPYIKSETLTLKLQSGLDLVLKG